MIKESLFVSLSGLILGIMIVFFLSKFGLKIRSKGEREKNKIIKNPELLLEKLNQNGVMVDQGERLNYNVIDEDGKKKLGLERSPAVVQMEPTQPVKKKVVKKPKKIVKKKRKKHGGRKGS
jgi:hypothetical protein